VSLKMRVKRLTEQIEVSERERSAPCPECHEPFNWFPLAFGDLPMCDTCGNLVIPPGTTEKLTQAASTHAPADGRG
jgi:hypothetical protein